MFQNVLAFMDKLFHKAGKGNRQDSSFKDQPDQEGFNPPDGRLIENHRQTLPKLSAASQGDMQGNQKLRGQVDIIQEPVEPLFSFLEQLPTEWVNVNNF